MTVQAYMKDPSAVLYAYEWGNGVFNHSSRSGNVENIVELHLCRLCEPGFFCANAGSSQ